jgi:hypothetical protein
MPLQKAAAWPKLLQYTPGNVPPDFDDRNMGHPNDQAVLLRLLERKEMARYGRNGVAKLMEHSYEYLLRDVATYESGALRVGQTTLSYGTATSISVGPARSVSPQYPEHDNERCAKARAVLKRKSNQELESGQI